MSTMADAILRHGFTTHHGAPAGASTEAIRDLIQEANVFKIDNVAQHILVDTAQEEWGREDFPEIRPPFDVSIWEYTFPRTINSNGELRDFGFDVRVGELIECRGGKLLVRRFMMTADGKPDLLPLMFTIDLKDGDAGSIISTDPNIPKELADGFGLGSFAVTFFALSLLSCRNVVAVAHDASRALNKKRQRRGHAPLVRFHTIEIGPVMQQINMRRNENGESFPTALHVCRGHFKTYEQNPLFGRVTGRFWWKAQARGEAKNGVVGNNYSVNVSGRDS